MKSYLLVAMVIVASGMSAESRQQMIVQPVPNAPAQAVRKNAGLILKGRAEMFMAIRTKQDIA